MRQYARFKARHPDCVLFFRMGDFYELFHDDAVLVHRVLGLTLTQRTEGIPMAGVPYHALEGYLRRMIEQGYRVAVCDQIQDPAEAKGVVDRAVTRVLTPGTLVDEALLEEGAANQIAAIRFTEAGESSAASLAVAELSTGRFILTDIPSDQVADELARFNPSELLHVETADGRPPPRVQRICQAIGCALTARPSWTFRLQDARDLLLAQYGVTTLAGFGLEEDDPAIGPAGALLRYLQETQAPDDREGAISGGGRLAHLRPPRRQPTDQFLIIDATSLQSLEIERTMRTGQSDGSLMSVIQRCVSPMGKRLLRQWLCFPLRDLSAIAARQRAVAALTDDRAFASALVRHVGGVQDVARIASRISMHRASPRDLVALGRSVAHLSDVAGLIDTRPAFRIQHQRLTELGESVSPLTETIVARCVESPPAHLREGGLFRDGIDGELDEARLLQRDANTWLAAYQKRLTEETAIPSLKVGYNKVFGYYIEITHTHAAKVPETFSRKQTLKNAERYITPELKEFEEKVTTAQARAIEREKVLFDRLCHQAAQHLGALTEYADIIAELDVLACFADIAARYGYVKPTIVDEPIIDIRGGRHPVLDRMLGRQFVPNDCVLGRSDGATERRSDEAESRAGRSSAPGAAEHDHAAADASHEGAEARRHEAKGAEENAGLDAPSGLQGSRPPSLALITGPNMAGKSTAIRQVALIVLLAHTGCFVPAEKATIGLTDRIFTRIGASDELHAGQSTFMVEMTETANILHHATDRSLVILDEIGRGTSTLDGLALAWAIAESIADIGCRALFATHYHELTSLADRLENVTNLHVSVREWGEEIIFLYRILPGRTDRSYGIHVAKIAGLPRATIDRASQVLETLAVHTDSPEVPEPSERAAPPPGAQLSLFTEYLPHPAVDALREIDLEKMTPIEAFDALRKLREKLQ
jgi:DNA mismatch repair protein MutS